MTGSQALEIAPLETVPDVTVAVPGSKSITNRALVCAALAEGTTTIAGALRADDTEAMIDGISVLGAAVESHPTALSVAGLGGPPPGASGEINVGQAGTAARFLPPVAALADGAYHFDGDSQIRARPMGPLLDALRALGARIEPDDAIALPFTVRGGADGGGALELPGDVSSQFLSGLMMAAPLMREGLTVELSTTLVSQPFVHMTASVMADFGAAAHVGERRVAVPRGAYRAVDYVVEPDASSASYFFALAAITGGRVTVAGLGADSRQGDLRFVRILEEMGADVVVGSGQVTVRGTGTLRGVTADLVDMSDVVPTLAVVAAFADGSTQIEGVGFIRGKESDRIGDLAAELEKCGVDVEEREDGLVVRPGPLHSATIDPHGDHRLAMALTVLGLAGPGVTILDPTCVAKTFPGFFDAVARLARSPR